MNMLTSENHSLSIFFHLKKSLIHQYSRAQGKHAFGILWDSQILCCITGTRWHHTPPQATWIQRKDVDALCTVSIIEQNWMLPVKTTMAISVAFLRMKDTAFSDCFVWTWFGTLKLLPAVPVLWWSCLWTCRVFLLIAACSPLTWRPGKGTRLPAAANKSFWWPSQLKICLNN